MKLKIIILISLFLLKPIFAEDGYYSLSYRMNSIVASIELNGIVLAEASKDAFRSGVATDLNLWIMPGENTLKIKLLKRFKKGKQNSDPKISVNIRFGQAGQSTEEGKDIVSFTLPESEEEKISFPFEKEIKFTLESVPPSQLWDQAEIITLDETSKKEILRLIQSLHGALNSGNAKVFLSLTEFKMNDMPKAMYAKDESNKEKNEKATSEFLKAMKGKLEKIPAHLSFKLIANDKIISVTDKSRGDIIKTKPSKAGFFKMAIYVSKINGEWTLVR